MKTMGVSEFKARCIEELKAVHATGESLVITWRKRPIARIEPCRVTPPRRELGTLRGRMTIHGDAVHCDFADHWERQG